MFNMMVMGRGNPAVTSVKGSPFNIKNINSEYIEKIKNK